MIAGGPLTSRCQRHMSACGEQTPLRPLDRDPAEPASSASATSPQRWVRSTRYRRAGGCPHDSVPRSARACPGRLPWALRSQRHGGAAFCRRRETRTATNGSSALADGKAFAMDALPAPACSLRQGRGPEGAKACAGGEGKSEGGRRGAGRRGAGELGITLTFACPSYRLHLPSPFHPRKLRPRRAVSCSVAEFFRVFARASNCPVVTCSSLCIFAHPFQAVTLSAVSHRCLPASRLLSQAESDSHVRRLPPGLFA